MRCCLNENGQIGEISGGYIAGYTSAENFTFGIKNESTGVIDLISGGYIYAEMDNGRFGPNAIALANWGQVEMITGGTFYAQSYNNNGSTHALRSKDSGHSATVTGGAFKAGKNYSVALLSDNGGVVDIQEGYYLSCADEEGFRYVKPVSDVDETVVYVLGSSVSRGEATRGFSFADMLDAEDNGITVLKSTVSGTTLVNGDSNSYVARLQSDFVGMPAPDYLIVQLSTNDASQNKKLGALTGADVTDLPEFDQQTVIGAIEYIIAYAKKTWDCEVIFYTNPVYESSQYAAMVEAVPEIAKKWGIGVVDFYNYGCMDEVGRLDILMNDSIHPNAAGYRWMAEVFGDYLNGISVDDANHNVVQNYVAGNEDERGRCSDCGAYAVDFIEAYTQVRANAENPANQDVRVLIEANEELLHQYGMAEISLEFTMKDGQKVTVAVEHKFEKAYTTVIANGEEVNAAGHCGFIGVVVTGVPGSGNANPAVRVAATVTFSTGSQTETVMLGTANIG